MTPNASSRWARVARSGPARGRGCRARSAPAPTWLRMTSFTADRKSPGAFAAASSRKGARISAYSGCGRAPAPRGSPASKTRQPSRLGIVDRRAEEFGERAAVAGRVADQPHPVRAPCGAAEAAHDGVGDRDRAVDNLIDAFDALCRDRVAERREAAANVEKRRSAGLARLQRVDDDLSASCTVAEFIDTKLVRPSELALVFAPTRSPKLSQPVALTLSVISRPRAV